MNRYLVGLLLTGAMVPLLLVGAEDKKPLTPREKTELANKAHPLLKKYCADCHVPGKNNVDDGNYLDYLFDVEKLKEKRKVREDNPERGSIYRKLDREQMPPDEKGIAQPTKEEREIMKKWALHGAPKWADAVVKKPPVPAFPPGGGGNALAGKELANQVYPLLSKYCSRCHGTTAKKGGLDPAKHIEKKHIPKGDPKDGEFYKKVHEGSMPPKAATLQPTAEERKLIEEWAIAGAPMWDENEFTKPREFKTLESVLTDMRDYLFKANERDRPFIRFFTLTHLHNTPSVSGVDLNLHRAALSKAVNSLSWHSRITVPRPVDKEETIYAIDVRDYKWDSSRVLRRPNLWRKLLEHYPYGLTFEDSPQKRIVNKLATDIYKYCGTELPMIRADWFISEATRPPLYHTMMRIPKSAKTLEKMLRVDVPENFEKNQLARAGFLKSGVSDQNRLIERHDALYGAYWKSYDFKAGQERGNLIRFPLGPGKELIPGTKYQDQAFEHDGGEIIFHLPNGLQGYMLIDGKDNRIDAGPTSVVSDENKTSGNVEIVNGLSCMYCHKAGMITNFKDEVRGGVELGGEAKEKVEDLYPTHKEMQELVAEDNAKFKFALERTMRPFFKKPDERKLDLATLPFEPVGLVARLYRSEPVTAERIAAELWIKDPREIQFAAKYSRTFREMGLKRLALEGGAVKRPQWELRRSGQRSPFQKASFELDKGTPYNVYGQ